MPHSNRTAQARALDTESPDSPPIVRERILRGPTMRTVEVIDPKTKTPKIDPKTKKKITKRVGDEGDLKRLYGIRFTREVLYRKVRAGTFPAPIKLSANRVGYLESEIVNWIRNLPRAVKPARGDRRD